MSKNELRTYIIENFEQLHKDLQEDYNKADSKDRKYLLNKWIGCATTIEQLITLFEIK